MVVRWDGGFVVNIITVDGQRIEQVKSFKYFVQLLRNMEETIGM